jgi:ATP/maltotriose-dependent transcriptional regulator MalT
MPHPVKITRPQAPSAVERPHLFARLDRLRRTGGAIWVSGPPGSGKTMLAASWLAARPPPAAWLRVDASDADPASFFHYLALAARGTSRRRAQLPFLLPEYAENLDAFARVFFRAAYALLPRGSVLVLDDCHAVAAPEAAFHRILRAAVEELPREVALVLVSRGELPPALARESAHGALQTIAAPELHLTTSEAWSIAVRGGFDGDRERVEALRRAVDGWAAGLVMLLAGAGHAGVGPEDRGATFDYFAGEVFEKADPDTRRVLLEAALLDTPAASLVEGVTGNPRAGRILSQLAGSGLFTIRRALEPPTYEFHALFRDFLLARGRDELPPGRAVEVRRAAARMLAAEGPELADKAIALLAEAGAHEEIAPLVVREAPALLATGRWQTVERWISLLPAEIRRTNPWILHVAGAALLSRDPGAAREHQERALAAFEALGDAVGVWLAWCAAVESLVFESNDFTPLAALLDVFERLSARFPFPTAEIQARATASAFFAASFHRLDHPRLPEWSQGVRAIAGSAAPAEVRLLAGGSLSAFEAFILGEGERNRELVRELDLLARRPGMAPIAKLSWFVLMMSYSFQAGDIETCVALPAEAEAAADEYGVSHFRSMNRLWEFVLAHHRAPDELPDALAAMEAALRPNRALFVAHLCFARGVVALLRGEVQAALGLAEDASLKANACGHVPTWLVSQLLLARVRVRNGDVADARRDLERIRDFGEQIGSSWVRFMVAVISAELLLDHGDPAAASPRLAEAFSLSREKGVHPFLVLAPEDSARLCAEALTRGIEREHVSAFVRKYALRPPARMRAPGAWPWPVRIQVIGPFELEVQGKPVGNGPRAPRKPLELLRVLIALGGRDVSEDAVAEALWPHADGDSAQQALETTLHRLRRLIGPDAIMHAGHRLTLADDLCWCDALELNALLGAALPALERGRAGANGDLVAEAERVVALYRGPLLQGDDAAPWVVQGRERLRRTVARWIDALEALPGDPAGAAQVRRRLELVDRAVASCAGEA